MRGSTLALDANEVLDIPLCSNHSIQTPLRYPGGKSVLSLFLMGLISDREDEQQVYVEPYAGGAGVALRLLSENKISKVVINDRDQIVYDFWDNAVNRADEFCKAFFSIDPTIEEWHRQKEAIANSASSLDRGVAFLFLNRTNRSGVINGGVIGGLSQDGKYKIDARYNKETLKKKLDFLKENASRIVVRNENGEALIREYSSIENAFFYIDPPYVEKGKSLYMNSLTEADHRSLSATLHEQQDSRWVLTYDDTALIRNLYSDCFGGKFRLSYSALSRRKAEELMFFSNSLWPTVKKGS